MKKLQNLLFALQNQPIARVDHHNQQVDGLYSGAQIPSFAPDASPIQFAQVLSHLGSVSDTVGNVYGLLSWQIFKEEEDRLIHRDGLSPNFAAKQVRHLSGL